MIEPLFSALSGARVGAVGYVGVVVDLVYCPNDI
jgi:hypothetical protein